MEEDLKILEEILKDIKADKNKACYVDRDSLIFPIIENLIAENKQLKEDNINLNDKLQMTKNSVVIGNLDVIDDNVLKSKMENLIEELTKVNPANLSEEGLKLFNKINEIIDKNRELEDKCIELSTTIDALETDNKELKEENEKIRKANKTLFELTQHTAMQEFINEDYISKSKVRDFLKKSKMVTSKNKEKTYLLIDVTEIKEELLQEGDK